MTAVAFIAVTAALGWWLVVTLVDAHQHTHKVVRSPHRTEGAGTARVSAPHLAGAVVAGLFLAGQMIEAVGR